MKHKIMVTQHLKVETWTLVEVEGATLTDAIEALDNGEVDLPSAVDDIDNVWIVERCSLEHEDYSPA
ncbi:MAG: hypothetical protein J0I80_08390 [Sphingomonas sp.]|nr:hypothetical protein [Sphingomonas sp.]